MFEIRWNCYLDTDDEVEMKIKMAFLLMRAQELGFESNLDVEFNEGRMFSQAEFREFLIETFRGMERMLDEIHQVVIAAKNVGDEIDAEWLLKEIAKAPQVMRANVEERM